MNKKVLIWEIIGIVFITLLGSFMHFLFEITGSWPPIGAIAAVNESVWEHLKLGYWPLVFFALIEYKFLKDEVNNFALAKFVGSLLIMGVIIVFFYSYTAILGEDLLILDILSFILSIVIAQLVSYKILTMKKLKNVVSIISLVGLLILGLLFILFTYFPPHIPLFQDAVSGGYGIVEHL
ncbi:MAG: DUF6512 family protein [Candidatus Hermodarchaeota archaeon]